jgi:hypothetical protein
MEVLMVIKLAMPLQLVVEQVVALGEHQQHPQLVMVLIMVEPLAAVVVVVLDKLRLVLFL